MRRRLFVGGLAVAATGLSVPSRSTATATAMPAGAGAGVGLGAAAGERAGSGAVWAGAWQEVVTPGGTEVAHLTAVAAANPERAWAVGEEGRDGATEGTPLALAWDGVDWSRTDISHLSYSGALRAVACSTPDQAWALGTDSAGLDQLLAWDGSTWRETGFPGRGEPGTQLTGVAASADGQVWVSGRHGDRAGLLHFERGTWRWCRPLPDPAAPTPSGVHVTPSGEVWVHGDVIARWDGAWTVLPRTLGIRAFVTGLLPVAHDDIWLTGYAYGVGGPPGKPPAVTLEHWDGTQWQSVQAPFTVGRLSGIVGDASGRPDRIAGWDFWDQKSAHYLRWDGDAWISERGPQVPTTFVPTDLVRVPGAPGPDYWSVGTTSSAPYPPAQVRVERYL